MAQWLKTDGMTARQMVDLPPIWLVGFICLVWLQAWLWPGATFAHWTLSAIGALLFWGGIALMIWAIWTFRAHATSVVPHQMPVTIITTGPFARSRNPIYLGDMMVLSGVILSHGAWPCLILLPIFAAILTRRFIAPEEARLKQNFGTDFEHYIKKTPRWL
jgi:protein-S-isoprenylcysteine O-methyltransferase Ste14